MRTFTYSDAKSHKFWSIELEGKSLTVTYGKIGSAGQTQIKEFSDEGKARKEADKLIREKLGKGYIETTPSAQVGGAAAHLVARGPRRVHPCRPGRPNVARRLRRLSAGARRPAR
jgi:predicted DNA-binding WGR domain protein